MLLRPDPYSLELAKFLQTVIFAAIQKLHQRKSSRLMKRNNTEKRKYSKKISVNLLQQKVSSERHCDECDPEVVVVFVVVVFVVVVMVVVVGVVVMALVEQYVVVTTDEVLMVGFVWGGSDSGSSVGGGSTPLPVVGLVVASVGSGGGNENSYDGGGDGDRGQM